MSKSRLNRYLVRRQWFDAAWRYLACRGQCDAVGGAEYRRVRRAWVLAGCPSRVLLWICDQANRGPSAPGEGGR